MTTLELSPILSAGFSTPKKGQPEVIDLVTPRGVGPSSDFNGFKSCARDIPFSCKDDDSESEIVFVSSPLLACALAPSAMLPTKRSGTDSIEILSPILTTKPAKALRRPQKSIRNFTVKKRSRSESFELISPPRHTKHAKTKQKDHTEDITLHHVQVHDFFLSLDEVCDAISAQEEPLGHKWIKNQTKLRRNGTVRRITFRCN